MDPKVNGRLFLSAIALIAVVGIIMSMHVSTTGQVSAYQHIPHSGGVQDQPDPHTLYIQIDEGVCQLVQERYTTFLTFAEKRCREMNPGRASREASCRYHAELDAEIICRPAPVFESFAPPKYLTGEVAVDPLGCAALAENYDIVVQNTLNDAPKQTVGIVNPCTGGVEAAVRQVFSPSGPLREYSRAAFAGGDVAGSVSSESTGDSNVRYVRCAAGAARVIVSGVSVCNTLS
jgi:hypothetical protein